MARLKSPGVPLEWHEVVAAVQDVAHLVKEGGYCSPTVDQLVIAPDGTLSIVSPRAARSREDDGRRVRGLGRLLRELLGEIPAPAQLALLAEEAVADPPKFVSVDDFSWQLSFFERPDRRAILTDAAARIVGSEEQARVDSELEGLTRKARQTEAPPQEKDTPKERRLRRGIGFAVAAVLVAAAAVVTMALRDRYDALSLASSSEAVAKAGGRLVDAIKSRAQTVLGAETTPASEATPLADVPREVQTRGAAPAPQGTEIQGRPATGLETAPFLFSRVMIPDPQSLADEWPSTTEGPGPAPSLPADGGIDPDAVYGPDDDGVTPPELVRPQLPAVPGAGVPADTLSVIEVLVSDDGSVDQVRVVANPASRRYYTAMLVAAVKTWKFRPAVSGDTPVRYRLRMALTQ